MQALSPRTKAPDLALTSTTGKPFVLSEALKRGPVVLAFFKVSCPVCQFAFPYLERLHGAYAGKNVTLVGVSQNDQKQTAAFLREYGITFPVLLDDSSTYAVSNAYGLTNVPTIFWIERDGEVGLTSVGWNRRDFEQINHLMAEAGRSTPAAVFAPGE